MNRIATIGRDSYVLPEGFSNEDALRLLDFLSGCRKVSDSGNYIADENGRYAQNACVIVDEPLEVAFKISAEPIMTRDEYNAAREAGEVKYRKTHPAEAAA